LNAGRAIRWALLAGASATAATAKAAAQGVALLGEAGGIGKVDGVVAGEGVPVRAVLDRVFADEAAEVGGVPTLALVLQAGGRVEQAAVVGEGGDDARGVGEAVGVSREALAIFARLARLQDEIGKGERLVPTSD
jgi:hypothetical protein